MNDSRVLRLDAWRHASHAIGLIHEFPFCYPCKWLPMQIARCMRFRSLNRDTCWTPWSLKVGCLKAHTLAHTDFLF